MYIHIYVYVYTYIHIHIYIYIYLSVHFDIYTCACKYQGVNRHVYRRHPCHRWHAASCGVTATHCNTLQHTPQHTATHRNTLQHTATRCNALFLPASLLAGANFGVTATYYNALQLTATHRNTLQHTAACCNILQHTATHYNTNTCHCCHAASCGVIATHCNTLQHTATHRNTPQHTATHCNTLLVAATHTSALVSIGIQERNENTAGASAPHPPPSIRHIEHVIAEYLEWMCRKSHELNEF